VRLDGVTPSSVVHGEGTATAAEAARAFHQAPSDTSASNGGARTTSASRAVATRVGRPSIDS
jgi:hypothetical protein